MFGPYHREHAFRTGLAPSSELGISFCPQPTSLLAAKPARSLWSLATRRKQWKLGFVVSSLYHYSKGFPQSYTHTHTLQLFFSPPISLGLPGNFQSEKGPWVGGRDTPRLQAGVAVHELWQKYNNTTIYQQIIGKMIGKINKLPPEIQSVAQPVCILTWV